MTLVGKPVTRVEDRRFLTGQGNYLPNRSFAGARYVVYVRSTMAHARLVGVSTDEASTRPGVVGVFTGDDLGLDAILPDQAGLGVNALMLRPWLATDVVRYVVEPIVAVVAETQALAVDAAEYVEVSYGPLPVVLDVREALKMRCSCSLTPDPISPTS